MSGVLVTRDWKGNLMLCDAETLICVPMWNTDPMDLALKGDLVTLEALQAFLAEERLTIR